MYRVKSIAVLAFVLAAMGGWVQGPACGAESSIQVLGNGTTEDAPRFEVLRATPEGVELRFELPALAIEEAVVDGASWQILAIPGGGAIGEIGQPELPVFGRLLAIPDQSGVRITATVEEADEYDGVRVLPAQPDDGGAFAIDLASYSRQGYSGDSPVTAGEPALTGGLRVVPLTVSPVDFDPAGERIRVARRIRVEVTFDGVDLRNTPDSTRPITRSFDQMFQQLVVNWENMRGEREVVDGTYLMICYNNSGVITRLQPLVEWRQRQGYKVHFVTTADTGTSANSIKAYIQGLWNAGEPLEYIVLVGDASGSYSIPCFFENLSGYGGEGDHPYSQLDGSDIYSDVHIGRLSFGSTAELETIVAKTVGYEKTPWLQSDPDWFHRAALVGDPFTSSGYSTVFVNQWVKTRLRQLGFVDSNIDTVFSGNMITGMTTALNRGDVVFCYRGFYGMSGWTNTNTYALNNGWKMPFAVMSTCGTGSFASGTARSEAFLRAGSPTTPKGAIAAIGTATTGTHTRFNNTYTYGTMAGLLDGVHFRTGVAHTIGKVALIVNYPTQQNWATIFCYWNSLMGDPAVQIWTDVPVAADVTHPTSLPVGANVIPVTVTAQGGPVAGARVCALRDGEIFAVAETDGDGVADVAIESATAGDILLTVTNRNQQPYLATVPVAVQPRFLGMEAITLDDDGIGESNGNGDGILNPTETVELRVRVKNFGTQSLSNITATLSTDDPYVLITDADESFGSLAAGASAWSQDDFDLILDAGCPDGHSAELEIVIRSGGEEWRSLITLEVVSSAFQYRSHSFTLAGGNSLLDPGETANLIVDIDNVGGAGATAPTATLLSLSQYIDLPGATAEYPDIAPSNHASNQNNPFRIHASPDCYPGYQAQMKMALEFSDGRKDTLWLAVPVGTRSSTDPSGPDGYGYWAFDNTDTAYPEAPVYQWVDIDPGYGGSGTQVTLGDTGEYQDKTRTVPLPFQFQYYGETYNTASICSNGWIVMGQTYLVNYRNYYLPSFGGPDGAIAAFWDDLYEQGGGHVYQYFDAANHRWIVQWSRMRNLNGGQTETFQAILYDPAYHPTDTGDGIIEFQYNSVSSSDATDGYFTTGIERPDNGDGLTWAYFNQYAPGAPTVTAGRAIRFVAKRETLTGIIEGTVRNSAGGGALAGATVTVLESDAQYQTGGDGKYQAIELPGSYTLTAERAGFAPDTVEAVGVQAGQIAVADFSLLDIVPPQIVLDRPILSTQDTLGPYTVESVLNDFSPLHAAQVFYRRYGDPFTALDLIPAGLGMWSAQIPGQPWTMRIDYYLRVEDGAGNVSFLPEGAPAEVFTFWVGPMVTAYADDLESDQGWTVGAPGDQATEGLWVRVDPNGTWSGSDPVQPEDDHTVEPGTNCWVTGNAEPGADQDANDVEGGRTTLFSPVYDLSHIDGAVIVRYWRWFTNDTGGAPAEDEFVVRASGDGVNWVDLERTTVSNRSWLMKEFALDGLLDVSSQVQFRVVATDGGDPSIVEAAIDDLEVLYIGLTPSGAEEPATPLRFGLAQTLPNPLRSGSGLSFELEKSARARLALYDIQGRRIRTLVDGNLSAGRHHAIWDGKDENGHSAPSGVYFLRLESGNRAESRKALVIH